MQSHRKALLREISSSKLRVLAEFISVCAAGLRASVLPCWLEVARSSLPCGPLWHRSWLHPNRESLLARWVLQLFVTFPQKWRPIIFALSIILLLLPVLGNTLDSTHSLGWGELYKGMNTRRQGPWGLVLEVSLPKMNSWADSQSRRRWYKSTWRKVESHGGDRQAKKRKINRLSYVLRCYFVRGESVLQIMEGNETIDIDKGRIGVNFEGKNKDWILPVVWFKSHCWWGLFF